MSSKQIKDTSTRKAIMDIESKVKRIENVSQLPKSASLEEVIIALNKITDSLKR